MQACPHGHTHTHKTNIFASKGIPPERSCAHSVYCSPQLLISCFPSVMRGHPMNREEGPLIKTAVGLVLSNQTALY